MRYTAALAAISTLLLVSCGSADDGSSGDQLEHECKSLSECPVGSEYCAFDINVICSPPGDEGELEKASLWCVACEDCPGGRFCESGSRCAPEEHCESFNPPDEYKCRTESEFEKTGFQCRENCISAEDCQTSCNHDPECCQKSESCSINNDLNQATCHLDMCNYQKGQP